MSMGHAFFSEEKAVSRQGQWRSTRPMARVIDILSGPATGGVLGASLVLMLVLPLMAVPVSLFLGWYLLWIGGRHYRLPMRVPQTWDGLDYSDNMPGSDTRFKKAEGLLFLGNDDEGRELWITNSDARRHKFVLGTTGSGKTEYLLGNIVQPLAWGSGFLFIDGKGTPEFYARIWSLAKRFGREDDVRLINFTGVSGQGEQDADALAGSLGSQSNTLNPFATGTADQLSNMIASLMSSGSGSGGDMWQDRAINLNSSLIRALVEMRDRGEIFMDVQAIRDFMPMGNGVPGGAVPQDMNRKDPVLDDITDTQWDAIRKDRSSGSLYLRSLKGDFSISTSLALKGFFDSLPGFSLVKLLAGEEQASTTNEQYGYLSMQLTKPLGTMADDYSHIFRTTLAEVSMEDVVYRRRILVVLLPALQKAPSETRNLGKIVVSMAKAMMGSASGSAVSGTREEIIESSPTRSSSPFLAVFDEAGYYLVQGMDVMAAQARSLGFSIIVGAQDIQAMRGEQKQVADSVIANTFLTAIGATVDANDSLEFIKRKVGTQKVLQTTGMERIDGLAGSGFREGGLAFSDVERLQVDELRNLGEGQFYFVFRDQVIKGRSFYVGNDLHHEFRVNSLVPLRGPLDTRQIQAGGGHTARFYIEELNKVMGIGHDEELPPCTEDEFPETADLLATLHTTRSLLPVSVEPSPVFTILLETFLAKASDHAGSTGYVSAADLDESDFPSQGEFDDSFPEASGEGLDPIEDIMAGMNLGLGPPAAPESEEAPPPAEEPPPVTTIPFKALTSPTRPPAAAEAGSPPDPDDHLLPEGELATPASLVSALANPPVAPLDDTVTLDDVDT